MTATENQERELTPAAHAPALRIFLIADICGYTRFTEEHGVEAAARLASRFADLADEIAGAWEGRVIELRGDEALAVFGSASDALHAAVAMQTRLLGGLDDGLTFQVRIGVDAGDAVAVRDGYRSGALNRAARLQSIARPGEVLASDVVVGLARTGDGLVYLDRGEARLKGLFAPVKVFGVVAEGHVPVDVPKFTVESMALSNLTAHVTRFIGRERELREVTALLQGDTVRLLTLVGPGGIGKTRLAIRAAESEAARYEGGTFLVPLASIRDVDSVFPAIGQALQLPEVHGQPSATTVTKFLRDRHFLLILDNFEQIVDAAPLVADLIATCPKLTVLVTSRIVLHVYGEHEYLVPPMSVPNRDAGLHAEHMDRYESVRLFLDRVALTDPTFALTELPLVDTAEPWFGGTT